MIKKLRSRAGLTLSELLITLLLMAMFSAACLVGVTTALKTRSDNIRIGDADVLGSMVSQIVSSEVRMCIKLETSPSSDEINYVYKEGAGSRTAVLWVDNGHLVKTLKSGAGEEISTEQMLNDAAYAQFTDSDEQALSIKDFKFEKDGDSWKCSFSIYDNTDTNLKSVTFYINPINIT